MNTLKAKYLLIFFFFLFTTTLYAQKIQPSGNSRETCQQLMDSAYQDTNQKKYSQAIEKLLKAKLMAEENQWNELLINVNLNLGNNFKHLSDYGEALSYYQKTLNIIQKDKKLDKEKACIPLMNIANIYGENKSYEESFKYYEEAYKLAKNDKSNHRRKQLAFNMAQFYIKVGKAQQALDILEETREKIELNLLNFLWESAYAKALLANGQTKEAKQLALQLYNRLKAGECEDNICFISVSGTLSDIYKKLNKTDSAIYFTKQSLKHTDYLLNYVESYEELAFLYTEKNDYITASIYKDSVIIAKDSLHNTISRGQYEAGKIKLKVRDYQNEVIREKERKRTLGFIYSGIILLCLIIIFSIYKRLKNNMVRQKQQAVIASLKLEKEKKEHLLVEEKLKREVADKNRELTAKALYTANRNQTIKEIVDSLESGNKLNENRDTRKQFSAIKELLKNEGQFDDFMKHFENVNPDFIKQLKEKHPKLTSNDTRFLCYVYMNLSLKEISTIFNITYDACVFRKRRIVEKLGFNKKEISLYDYLLSISH